MVGLDTIFGAGVLAALGALLFLFVIIALAVYIYMAFALMTIGKKLKYKYPWLAWIPFANMSMVLQMGEFHWAWVFLMLIPILGWIALAVLILISTWRIFEKRKYSGWLSLIPLLSFIPFINWLVGIAYLVVLGLVAWRDNTHSRN